MVTHTSQCHEHARTNHQDERALKVLNGECLPQDKDISYSTSTQQAWDHSLITFHVITGARPGRRRCRRRSSYMRGRRRGSGGAGKGSEASQDKEAGAKVPVQLIRPEAPGLEQAIAGDSPSAQVRVHVLAMDPEASSESCKCTCVPARLKRVHHMMHAHTHV